MKADAKGGFKKGGGLTTPRDRADFHLHFHPFRAAFRCQPRLNPVQFAMNPAVSYRRQSVMARATGSCSPAAPAVASSLNPVCLAADQRPVFDRTPIPGLPVGVFGFQNEAGLDGEVERGLILKADVNRMVPAGSEDLDKVHGLAFDLFKAIERAPAVTADRRLASLGLGKAQRLWDSLSLLWFFGIFAE